ncbi:MAG: hypothetical protein AUK47_07005 [Deltaproteobacteria bacterium CG2_30_63_29]|nr:MAG: hypothetical protein AUK47_07005 [Deltaproteobacteria bacterium CG2_30_63_29]PJB36708.1 MAG: hypothetical protein CO108_22815 [Deltaproteobacteria bacterium CG_4_9_14_3_um_filter_63_12]
MNPRNNELWRPLLASVALLAVVFWPMIGSAEGTDVRLDGTEEMGVATLLGPQLGLSGPPTALKLQVQFWRALAPDFAFLAATGLTIGGETTFEGDGATPDAQFNSTVGGEFSANVRYQLDFGWPLLTYVRGGLAVDFTGSDGLIGYMVGPTAAATVTYPVSPELELIAETEFGLGFGQYKGSGSTLASTLDVLVGAQVRF